MDINTNKGSSLVKGMDLLATSPAGNPCSRLIKISIKLIIFNYNPSLTLPKEGLFPPCPWAPASLCGLYREAPGKLGLNSLPEPSTLQAPSSWALGEAERRGRSGRGGAEGAGGAGRRGWPEGRTRSAPRSAGLRGLRPGGRRPSRCPGLGGGLRAPHSQDHPVQQAFEQPDFSEQQVHLGLQGPRGGFQGRLRGAGGRRGAGGSACGGPRPGGGGVRGGDDRRRRRGRQGLSGGKRLVPGRQGRGLRALGGGGRVAGRPCGRTHSGGRGAGSGRGGRSAGAGGGGRRGACTAGRGAATHRAPGAAATRCACGRCGRPWPPRTSAPPARRPRPRGRGTRPPSRSGARRGCACRRRTAAAPRASAGAGASRSAGPPRPAPRAPPSAPAPRTALRGGQGGPPVRPEPAPPRRRALSVSVRTPRPQEARRVGGRAPETRPRAHEGGTSSASAREEASVPASPRPAGSPPLGGPCSA